VHIRLLLGAGLMAAVTFGAVLGYSRTVHANDIAPYQTVYGTDYVSAGYGGMRGIGTGTITLAGVSGTVTKALLFWHGPTNSADPTVNAAVTFNGAPIVGTNIGLSSDNCWGFTNSQAYRADVTSLVTGNGAYSLANFTNASAEINGVSLMVFFNDGNVANNRDIVMFDGNDSNTPNSYDATGWNVSLPGINYSSGSASMELHVSDGQTFEDAALILNAQTLAAAPDVFQGDSVPNGPGLRNGGLWDIKSYDVTSYLTPGPNTLTLTSGYSGGDCLSLIAAVVNLPAGAAPAQPNPTAVAAKPTPCIGGIVSSRCPGNPPVVNVTPTSTGTAPLATATTAPATATVAPPQPTATKPGGGAAGTITGPDTGTGPGASAAPLAALFASAVLLLGGAVASVASVRIRRR
jgi:hypothetical protein